MTDDLVKRLRHQADTAKKNYPEVARVSEDIAYEAASRIEKLGAALREVLSWVDQYSFDAAYDDHWPAIEELARKALEGKDD